MGKMNSEMETSKSQKHIELNNKIEENPKQKSVFSKIQSYFNKDEKIRDDVGSEDLDEHLQDDELEA